MDDTLCLGTLYTVCINMAHNIMTDFLFPCLCHIVVDVVRMCFQLVNLFLCNGETQFLFRFCQGNP